MPLESMKYSRGSLELLDQKILPGKFEYITINDSQDGWEAIRKMTIRGAPAIAVSAALSLAVEANKHLDDPSLSSDSQAAAKWIVDKLEHLKTSRPTAVNLFEAADRLSAFVNGLKVEGEAPGKTLLLEYIKEAEKMLEKDVQDNKAIGEHGAEAIIKAAAEKGKKGELNILTHCNTGSLATCGYGTALGVIRSLHEKGVLGRAFCTETRPYNQGSRLTALELTHDKLPTTLVTDSMVGFLMAKKGIDAVVVGADRVAANGDTANKIGTYLLAISAKHHGVPFFIAAPCTTLDPAIPSGDGIVIEERGTREVTHFGTFQIAPEDVHVWNPAFDVTPHSLITGVISEKGLVPRSAGDDGFDVPAFLKAC